MFRASDNLLLVDIDIRTDSDKLRHDSSVSPSLWLPVSHLRQWLGSFLHVRIRNYARVSTVHWECICTHCSNPKPNPPPLLIYLLYSLHWEARVTWTSCDHQGQFWQLTSVTLPSCNRHGSVEQLFIIPDLQLLALALRSLLESLAATIRQQKHGRGLNIVHIWTT